MRPDYLLLGHFTRDVLPDRTTIPGGTSLYAALTAHRLGLSVAVVSAPAELPADWPRAIQLAFHASPTPPTFENIYTPQGRRQILHTSSQPITLDAIPAGWQHAPVIHLGPILGETPEQLVFAFPGALIGVTPQGWMRVWNQPLPSPVIYQPWRPDPAVLARIDALVLSIEDVRGDEALAASYAQHCRLVALTRGASGATLFVDGSAHSIPAFAATERDPTGAGDVFAATLFARLHETGDPLSAARYAAYVAALSVEGVGVSAIAGRAAIDQGLAQRSALPAQAPEAPPTP
jgi:sugar/nucleoside kinase (ribokinase family)